MRYYYDCEFLEDGKTIDLISIGIVAEDGREYYAVSNEFDTRRVAANKWLMENVMSSIQHEQFVIADFQGKPLMRDIYVTDPAARSRTQIAYDIMYFIGADREPQFWAWYSAYDHVCLAQLWGKMIDLPNLIPMYTNDIRTLADLYPNDKAPAQPAGHHNALDDARWNVVRYNHYLKVGANG